MTAPTPRLLAALLLLTFTTHSASAACPARRDCQFGELPGYYNAGSAWQVVGASSCCSLADHVGAALAAPLGTSNSSATAAEVSVLIFGDSVERITLHDVCEQGEFENWGHGQEVFHTCRRGPVLLARQSMVGTHPLSAGTFNLTGSPFERIDAVSGFCVAGLHGVHAPPVSSLHETSCCAQNNAVLL
jgi:hypothetical protein